VINLPREGVFTPSDNIELAAFRRLSGLPKFMLKWGCSPALNGILHDQLEKLVHVNVHTAILLLLVGASIESLPLLRLALRAWYGFHRHDLHPSKWPFWVWKHCPLAYLVPFNRACADHGITGALIPFPTLEANFFAYVEQFKKENAEEEVSVEQAGAYNVERGIAGELGLARLVICSVAWLEQKYETDGCVARCVCAACAENVHRRHRGVCRLHTAPLLAPVCHGFALWMPAP
jgi:hypothetical protein